MLRNAAHMIQFHPIQGHPIPMPPARSRAPGFLDALHPAICPAENGYINIPQTYPTLIGK